MALVWLVWMVFTAYLLHRLCARVGFVCDCLRDIAECSVCQGVGDLCGDGDGDDGE